MIVSHNAILGISLGLALSFPMRLSDPSLNLVLVLKRRALGFSFFLYHCCSCRVKDELEL